MFRNVAAHAAKIEWEIKEHNALDIMSLGLLCNRRLDGAKKIKP